MGPIPTGAQESNRSMAPRAHKQNNVQYNLLPTIHTKYLSQRGMVKQVLQIPKLSTVSLNLGEELLLTVFRVSSRFFITEISGSICVPGRI